MERKYYFITYEWSRYAGDKFKENKVMDRHPLDWLSERVEDKSDTTDIDILFFTEISEETYKKYKDRW